MLLKKLKEIINESEPEKTKPTPEKSKNDENSDGIGAEAYDMAIKLAEYLETNLKPDYDVIKNVKASKGLVILEGGAKAKNIDGFEDGLKMYLAAGMGNDMKYYEDPLITIMGNDIKILIRFKG